MFSKYSNRFKVQGSSSEFGVSKFKIQEVVLTENLIFHQNLSKFVLIVYNGTVSTVLLSLHPHDTLSKKLIINFHGNIP